MLNLLLSEAIVGIKVVVVFTIIATALLGSRACGFAALAARADATADLR